MKALYKRIVTLGMISITAILAWIYCMVEYRSSAVYVIGASLALVASVYALLLTAMNLYSAKEEDLKKYIDETVASALSNEDSTATKLNKASYVHMRKITSVVSRMEDANAINSERQEKLLTELSSNANSNINQSINKALKLVLKYNEVNNNKLLSSLGKLTNDLETVSSLMEKCSEDERVAFAESINALSNDIIQIRNRIISMSGKISEISAEASAEEPKDSLDIFEEKELGSADILSQLEGMSPESEEDDGNLEFATDEEIIDADDKAAIGDTTATQADIDSETAEEADSADVSDDDITSAIINAVPDASVVADDPNKQLSPDDIAALFAQAEQSATEAVATEDNADTEIESQKIADVIPFPTAEDTSTVENASEGESEEPAISSEFDPNKQLSPDEIAALFASAMPAPEPEPEPEPVAPAVSDDPNKQLSPDEIAALFASAAPAPEPEPEPEPVAPVVSDDPNKQLSPDEIAALFASMQ